MPHGGSVLRNGKTGLAEEHGHTVEFSLSLDSNPEFTASVLVACARAVYRMAARGSIGCKTVLDIAPADLSPLSPEQLRAQLL
jgi:diaminopimelate dehydrogenase